MAKGDSPKIPQDIAKMSFEAALAELEGIVRLLEEGKGKLDAAIDSYERGAALKRHCEEKLRQARERIEKISLGSEGAVETEPLEID